MKIDERKFEGMFTHSKKNRFEETMNENQKNQGVCYILNKIMRWKWKKENESVCYFLDKITGLMINKRKWSVCYVHLKNKLAGDEGKKSEDMLRTNIN